MQLGMVVGWPDPAPICPHSPKKLTLILSLFSSSICSPPGKMLLFSKLALGTTTASEGSSPCGLNVYPGRSSPATPNLGTGRFSRRTLGPPCPITYAPAPRSGTAMLSTSRLNSTSDPFVHNARVEITHLWEGNAALKAENTELLGYVNTECVSLSSSAILT